MTDETKQSLMTFPCDFVIKVFGVATEQFQSEVTEIVKRHITDLHETAIRARQSKDDKYLSLSITVHVNNQKELDDIYLDLTANPHVLMAL